MIQKRTARGFSLIETMVAFAVGSLVFGLVVGTLISTQSAANRLSQDQQVKQEALLISQSIERVLRYRISPTELAAMSGGAEQDGPVAGGESDEEVPATGTLPASIAPLMSQPTIEAAEKALEQAKPEGDESSTSPTLPASRARQTTAPRTTNRQDAFTSLPVSVRQLLTTGSVRKVPDRPPVRQMESPPKAMGGERFAPNELVVYSLTTGSDPTRILTALRNVPGIAGTGSNAYLEQSAAGDTFNPGTRHRGLGLNPDRFQSQVTFRYASETENLNARWQRESEIIPKLVEYTVRVWPRQEGDPDFENTKSPEGRPLGFQITSAVALR